MRYILLHFDDYKSLIYSGFVNKKFILAHSRRCGVEMNCIIGARSSGRSGLGPQAGGCAVCVNLLTIYVLN